ncbi:MAG TPA: hypothetical protein PKC43_05975 [Phycisphaerales bacterium]|nr:hypothetical protein [Phycisphaerales bacterium]HMP36980.1 hypothetical protein [Phycisphaerales bacterium]
MAKRRTESPGTARERLESMIELAQSYRGWTQREAADALGRNVHAIIPDSGNPKLDMVVSLSEILDWPIEMIVADLRGKMDAPGVPGEAGLPAGPPISADDAKAIVRRAWELGRDEQWSALLEFSAPQKHSRLDGETFAHLMYYRQVALESDGRYLEAIDSCRRGLRRVSRRAEAACRLRAVLAYALCMTGQLYEAGAIAIELVNELRDVPRASVMRTLLGYASFVRGMTLRLQAECAGADSREILLDARAALELAADVFDDYLARPSSPKDASFAQKARSAAGEIGVLLGERTPVDYVDETIRSLGTAFDLATVSSWDAESLGWCCVFAARTVIRSLGAFEHPDQVLGILTNKVDEVAERLGHWALRQQLFTIEHIYRVLGDHADETPPQWNFDETDIRTLMGTMGRFPEFREIGWQILRAVQAERKEAR